MSGLWAYAPSCYQSFRVYKEFWHILQAVDIPSPKYEPEVTIGEVIDVKKLLSSQEEWRKEKLLEELHLEEVPTPEMPQLRELLIQNHMVFSLEDGEHGDVH